jgi:hypothetical protein
MDTINRRRLLGGILGSAFAAGSLVLAPEATEAQVVVTGPRHRPQWHHRHTRHRPRRWVCWWHRGRRVCGWR